MEMGKLKKMFSIALSCVFLLTLCNVESVFAADFTADCNIKLNMQIE